MARSFNGTSDVITYSGAILTATPLTLAAWFQTNSLTASQCIASVCSTSGASQLDGWQLRINTSGQFFIAAGNGTTLSITSGSALTTGKWYHGVGLFASDSNRQSYLNGSLIDTRTTTITPTNINRLYAGAVYIGGIGTFLNGLVAEIAVWNVALTPQEIAALAAGRLPNRVRAASLVAYWPLFGLQSPEPDMSGNAQNGTLTGTARANHAPVTPFTRRRPKVFSLSAGGASTFPTGLWEGIMRLVHYPKTVQLPRRPCLLPLQTLQTVPFPVFVRRTQRQPLFVRRAPLPFVTTNPVLVRTPPLRRQMRQYYPQKRPVVILPGVNTTTTVYVPLAKPGRLVPARREPSRVRGVIIVSGNPILLPAPPRVRQTRVHQPRIQRVVIATGGESSVIVPLLLPLKQRQARHLPARTRSVVIIQQNPVLIPVNRRSNLRSYYPRQVGRAAAILPIQTVQVPVLARTPRIHTRSYFPRRLPTLVIPGVTTNTIVTLPIARPARIVPGRREPGRVRTAVISNTNTILLPVQKRAALQRSYYPRRVNIAAALVHHPIPIVMRRPLVQVRVPYPVRRLTAALPLPGPTVHVPVPILCAPRQVQVRRSYPLRRNVPTLMVSVPVPLPRRVIQTRVPYWQRTAAAVLQAIKQVPTPLPFRRLVQTRLYYPSKRSAVGPLLPVLTVTQIQPLPVLSRRTQYVRMYYPRARPVVGCLLPGPVQFVPLPSPRRLVLSRSYLPVRRNGMAALLQSVNVTNTVLVQSKRVVR